MRGVARTLPALVDHRRLRLTAFSGLYFAQGLPEGLLYVAVPAWLAQAGVEAGAIGAYIGVILIPWSLKLINGGIMDRWSFLVMGRRRPWVIAAQLGLIGALVAFGLTPNPTTNLLMLTVAGVAVNFFGAFQDVAVDGMAIDIVPHEEQARANGVMWGSKTLGIAASTALGGWLLSGFGLLTAALVLAALIACIMIIPISLRERPGERLAPWSNGTASAVSLERHMGDWLTIFQRLRHAVLQADSLFLIAAIFTALMTYGLFIAAMPVFVVQELGWSDTEFTNIEAQAGLLSGVFGIVIGGYITDKIGTGRTLTITLLLIALLHITIALTPQLWASTGVIAGYLIGYQILFVLMSIAIYATAMRMSVLNVAATQFALFMAFVNLGTSAGAAILGLLRNTFDYSGVIMAMAVISLFAIVLFRRASRSFAMPR